MKLFRRFICYLFGCRSIMTYQKFYINQHDNMLDGEVIYECERCGHER